MNEIDRMMIERECERLVVAYTHLVDFGEAGKVAELFTEDGTWSAPGVTMKGWDQIRDGFATREDMPRMSKHVCTNLQIEVLDEDHAKGVVYLTLYRTDTDEAVARINGPMLVGHYRDEFARTDDGWRFASRQTELTFLGS